MLRADLQGAVLNGANLSHAILRDANLFLAELHGTNLRNADLSGANLKWADLRSADLSFADLTGATVLSNEELHEITFAAYGIAGPIIAGATMPNGQKYEDWLKSRGEDDSGSS
jgi:uncharacterized protein YjbI with pentapeptide repeats